MPIIFINDSFQLKGPVKPTLIRVADAYTAFAIMLGKYQELIQQQLSGIQEPAYIAKTASLGKNVFIGAFCYIGENVKIGDNTKIFPHTYSFFLLLLHFLDQKWVDLQYQYHWRLPYF